MMRRGVLFLLVFLLPFLSYSKLVRDTITTKQKDRIILTYEVSNNGGDAVIRFENKPRIIPGEYLREACKGDLELLKVVIFDRVGDFGKVKWKGVSPTAFMVPSGLSYNKSDDGFYILGETTTPFTFTNIAADKRNISFPLYLAVYEKKQTYKLICSSSQPLNIPVRHHSSLSSREHSGAKTTEQISIKSSEELATENEDIVKALSSIQMVKQLITAETEFPFSQALQMEIYNLRSLKDKLNDSEIIEKINDVLLLCNDKERELKESQREASLTAQAQEQALIAQQKAEEDARLKEADEKSRLQEEKQQKRTLWMIVGGVLLAILTFIGNAIFKHFRDIRNQRTIMEMQESLVRQAGYEAGRRSREIVRNKAHQLANKGKSKMRNSLKDKSTNKTSKNTKIKSI